MKNGSVGEIAAQLSFLKQGYEVYAPVTDNTTFDFMVHRDGILETVEVKSTNTRTRQDTGWVVQLKSTRSNRNTNRIKNFDNTKMDYLSVYVEPLDKIITYRTLDVQSKSALVIRDL